MSNCQKVPANSYMSVWDRDLAPGIYVELLQQTHMSVVALSPRWDLLDTGTPPNFGKKAAKNSGPDYKDEYEDPQSSTILQRL